MAWSVVAAHLESIGKSKAEDVHSFQGDASHPIMRCSNYLRMRKNYEEAQKRWRQSAIASRDIDIDKEALKIAFYKRNVAKDRLVLHEQNCVVCNRTSEP
jgi:hypothetical protein